MRTPPNRHERKQKSLSDLSPRSREENSLLLRMWQMSWMRWTVLLLLSFSLHLGIFFSFAGGASRRSEKQLHKLKFRLITPRPKPPEPPKPRVERPKPPPRPVVKKKPKKKKPNKRPPKKRPPKKLPPRVPPPPPNQTPPKTADTTAKPTFGLTKSSLGKGPGKVAFRQGNTLMMDPDKNPPREIKPYAPPRTEPPPPRRVTFEPVPLLDIDENPREIQKTKALYPPDAKRDGIEAVVVLSVQIRKNGRVRKSRVISIRPPQANRYGFGASAVRALQAYRFAPARAKGQAVDVVVRYIYRFELDD